MTQRYPACRDLLLRNHVWAFAKKATSLAALSEASSLGDWVYKVQLPTDIARILSVMVNEAPQDYERVGNVLHVVEAPVDLRYVQNFSGVTDAFLFPDDFAEALAFYLAGDLAQSITQSDNLSRSNFQLYNDSIRQARFNGAVETASPDNYNDWLAVHNGLSSQIDPTVRGLAGY